MYSENACVLVEHGIEDRHDEVLKCYDTLDEEDKLYELVMITYADALYEQGNDLSALGAYLAVIEQHPKGKHVDFARFGAAMALKNIDLQDAALKMLLSIHADHIGLNAELDHSYHALEVQAKAMAMMKQSKLWKE